MKGRIIIGILVVGAALLQSCSKDVVDIPESNDPVFMINGTFAGESISLVAGDNSAYMFTNTHNVNGVNFYAGNISDGNLSIELGIYDGMLDMPNHHPEVEISNVSPTFAHCETAPITILSKEMFSNQQFISQIVWKVDGVNMGINEAVINEPGRYDVCAEISYQGGATETLCNDLIIGYDRSANCSIDFSTTGGYLDAGLVNSSGIGIDNVQWYLDNVEVAVGTVAQVQIGSGLKQLSADIHFANGAVRRKNVLVDASEPMHNIEDFTMFEDSSSNITLRDFNIAMTIEQDGQIYQSEFADNEAAEVEILDVVYYGKNDNNKDVYKITANIEAIVESVSTLKQLPVSFTTSFGIEIP